MCWCKRERLSFPLLVPLLCCDAKGAARTLELLHTGNVECVDNWGERRVQDSLHQGTGLSYQGLSGSRVFRSTWDSVFVSKHDRLTSIQRMRQRQMVTDGYSFGVNLNNVKFAIPPPANEMGSICKMYLLGEQVSEWTGGAGGNQRPCNNLGTGRAEIQYKRYVVGLSDGAGCGSISDHR